MQPIGKMSLFLTLFEPKYYRPQELDEAARRRFVKRLYIPLPCEEARREIVERLIRQQKHSLTPDDLDTIAGKSEGTSIPF